MGPWSTLDAALAALGRLAAPAARVAWLGLGVHLVGDRLDDRWAAVVEAVWAWPALAPRVAEGGWPEPLAVGAGLALVVEIAVLVRLLPWVLPAPAPAPGPRGLRVGLDAGRAAAVVAALCLGAAGAWSLAMAVEDALPPGPAGRALGAAAAVGVIARLGPGFWARARALPPSPRRARGLPSALLLLPVAALAVVDALPIWGAVDALVAGRLP